MISKALNKKRGFTLLEMLVATSVFVVVFLMVGVLIIDIIRMQARARAMRTIQEEARYALEEITREGRLAQGSDLPFSIGEDGNSAIFKIKNNEQKIVTLKDNKLQITRVIQGVASSSVELTSDKVKVLPIEGNSIFYLESNSSCGIQFLTIKFKVEANPQRFPSYVRDISAGFQTSITSRKYATGY